jgi:hypothetical protein
MAEVVDPISFGNFGRSEMAGCWAARVQSVVVLGICNRPATNVSYGSRPAVPTTLAARPVYPRKLPTSRRRQSRQP